LTTLPADLNFLPFLTKGEGKKEKKYTGYLKLIIKGLR